MSRCAHAGQDASALEYGEVRVGAVRSNGRQWRSERGYSALADCTLLSSRAVPPSLHRIPSQPYSMTPALSTPAAQSRRQVWKEGCARSLPRGQADHREEEPPLREDPQELWYRCVPAGERRRTDPLQASRSSPSPTSLASSSGPNTFVCSARRSSSTSASRSPRQLPSSRRRSTRTLPPSSSVSSTSTRARPSRRRRSASRPAPSRLPTARSRTSPRSPSSSSLA